MDYTRNIQSSPSADVNNFSNRFMDYLVSEQVALSTPDRRAISSAFRALAKQKKETLFEMSMEELVSELNGKVPVVTSYAEQKNGMDFLDEAGEPEEAPDGSDMPITDTLAEVPSMPAATAPESQADTDQPKQSENSGQKNRKAPAAGKKAVASQTSSAKKQSKNKDSEASQSPADAIQSIQSIIDLPRAGLLSQEMRQKKEALMKKRDWYSRTMTLRATDAAIMKSLVDMTAEMRREGKDPVLYDTRLGSYEALIHVMLISFLDKLQTDKEKQYLDCVYQAVDKEKKRRDAIEQEIQKLS